MTEKIIVKDLVKQDPGSALVYLYEFEYAKDTFAYFADGLDASLSEVTMLDYSNNSQTNTYSDEVQCPTWDDLDQKAYTYLMDNWSKFFQDHPNGVDFIPNKDLIKSTNFTGVFSSKDFDEDCLYDFTGIWNFLTLYQL